MEQSEYLIDSNVIIDYLSNKLPLSGMDFMHEIVDNVPNISVITKIEVLGFSAPREYQQLLFNFMNDASIYNLTDPIVEATIEIRKKHKTKLPDAIIAATAVKYNHILLTRNITDFKNIGDLQVVDLHSL